MASLGRFSERAFVLSAVEINPASVGAVRIGGPLLFGRPWKRLGIDAVLKGVLAGRQLGFDVERAVFVATLLRENKSHVQLVRSCPGFKGQRQPGNHKNVNHLTHPEKPLKDINLTCHACIQAAFSISMRQVRWPSEKSEHCVLASAKVNYEEVIP